MAQDTRKDPRAKVLSMTVRYKSATVDEFIEHHSHDVSRGGIFIKTQNPFLPGTLLKFEIRIADDKPMLQGVGRVVWKREGTQPDNPGGMGVKFIKLDETSRALLDRLVSSKSSDSSSFEAGFPAATGAAATTLTTPRPPSAAPVPGSATAAFGSSGAALRRTMLGVAPKGEASAPPPKVSVPTPTEGMFPTGTSESDLPPPEERTVMRQAAALLEEAMRGAGSSMDDLTPGPAPTFESPVSARPNLKRTMIGVPAPAGGDNPSSPSATSASSGESFDGAPEAATTRRPSLSTPDEGAAKWDEDEPATMRREPSGAAPPPVSPGKPMSPPAAAARPSSTPQLSGAASSAIPAKRESVATSPATHVPAPGPRTSGQAVASSPAHAEEARGGKAFLYLGLVAAAAVIAYLVWGEKSPSTNSTITDVTPPALAPSPKPMAEPAAVSPPAAEPAALPSTSPSAATLPAPAASVAGVHSGAVALPSPSAPLAAGAAKPAPSNSTATPHGTETSEKKPPAVAVMPAPQVAPATEPRPSASTANPQSSASAPSKPAPKPAAPRPKAEPKPKPPADDNPY